MPATINDLPYELISQILELAILFNAEQNSRKKCDFDMRLHATPDPDLRMPRPGGYTLPPDSTRWDASNTIRQVNSRWHALALEYAFKEMVRIFPTLCLPLSSYTRLYTRLKKKAPTAAQPRRLRTQNPDLSKKS